MVASRPRRSRSASAALTTDAASDRDAISALVYTYAERLDAGDLAGVATLFRHATFRSDRRPEVRRGRKEVLRVFTETVALYDGKPCTQHVTTNLIIEVNAAAGRAAARSKFTVLQARPELPLQVILSGRYHDRFARGPRGWRFTDRLILVDLIGDLRFHLKSDPFAPSRETRGTLVRGRKRGRFLRTGRPRP